MTCPASVVVALWNLSALRAITMPRERFNFSRALRSTAFINQRFRFPHLPSLAIGLLWCMSKTRSAIPEFTKRATFKLSVSLLPSVSPLSKM